jgi:TetR/AcrR family transcriptional regulator
VGRRKDAARQRAGARAPRRRARPVAADGGSRERLLTAAAAEFASRGFAGANVDRIARAARVNKAMIYYHFGSKAALYREILGDMFNAVAGRMREVTASAAAPEDKLKSFVEAIAIEAEARPHFPPIWLREIAESGVHLDERALADIGAVVHSLMAIINQGIGHSRFERVNPFLVHASIVGPLLLYFATAEVRRKLAQAGVRQVTGFTRDDVVAHVQKMTLGLVLGRI